MSITYGAPGKKEIRKNEVGKTQIGPISQVFYLACVRLQHSTRSTLQVIAKLQSEVIEVTTIHHLRQETPRIMCVAIEACGADARVARSLPRVLRHACGGATSTRQDQRELLRDYWPTGHPTLYLFQFPHVPCVLCPACFQQGK